VLFGTVAFVAGEAECREHLVPLAHAVITGDFGEDGGSGDALTLGIAFDDGLLGEWEIDGNGVDEEVIAGGPELEDSAAHREAGGLKDVDAVDVVGIGRGDGGGDRAAANGLGEFLTAFGVDELAVVEAANGFVGVEDDGGGVNGSEEGSPADLVYSGDEVKASGSGGSLVFSGTAHLITSVVRGVLLQCAHPWRLTPSRVVRRESLLRPVCPIEW
jgi:hypothetical protein